MSKTFEDILSALTEFEHHLSSNTLPFAHMQFTFLLSKASELDDPLTKHFLALTHQLLCDYCAAGEKDAAIKIVYKILKMRPLVFHQEIERNTQIEFYVYTARLLGEYSQPALAALLLGEAFRVSGAESQEFIDKAYLCCFQCSH